MKCVFCDKELKLVSEEFLQPYGGGEVQFIFCYGSCKFDLSSGTTVYRGFVCDDCAEKYVKKMKLQLSEM